MTRINEWFCCVCDELIEYADFTYDENGVRHSRCLPPEPTCHLPHWINPDTNMCEHTDHDYEP